MMITALLLSVLVQCPGGVCSVQAPAPTARSAPAVTYSYSASVIYQSSTTCTTQKRGLFKRLFRKA